MTIIGKDRNAISDSICLHLAGTLIEPEKWLESQAELAQLRFVSKGFRDTVDSLVSQKWASYRQLANENDILKLKIETKKEKLQGLTSWKSTIGGLCGNVACALKSFFVSPPTLNEDRVQNEDKVQKLKEKISGLEKTKTENEKKLLAIRLAPMNSLEKIMDLFGGGPLGWQRLPEFDLKSKDNGRDYIDFIKVEWLTAPIMRAQDRDNRHCMIIRYREGLRSCCQTIHSRFGGEKWLTVPVHGYKALVDSDEFLEAGKANLDAYWAFNRAIKENKLC